MKNENGVTLITVVMMIIVMGVIASISIITSKDILKNSKENVNEQNKVAVQSAVSRYHAKLTTGGLFTPANMDLPGIKDPIFEHIYKDENGAMATENKHVGEDWYLLLEDGLEEMGITYAKENYLVNYRENIVIGLSNVNDVFAEIAIYEE